MTAFVFADLDLTPVIEVTVCVSVGVSATIALTLCVLGVEITVKLHKMVQSFDSASIRIVVIITTVFVGFALKILFDYFVIISAFKTHRRYWFLSLIPMASNLIQTITVYYLHSRSLRQ